LDFDKLMRWREFAQKYYGNDFWSGVFESEPGKQVLSSFNEMFGEQQSNFPRIDLYKNNNELIILIELPGLTNRENLELQLAGKNRLIIKGVIPNPYPGYTNIAAERYYGPFNREIQLPEEPDKDRGTAKFHNGLLEIRFPCRENIEEETVKIEIK